MIFKNRSSAAQQLAVCLSQYKGKNPLIMALPRGAVPMGRIIADELHGELGIILASKISLPGYEEYAIGAVSEGGFLYKNPEVVSYDIPDKVYQQAQARQLARMKERRQAWRLDQLKQDVQDRVTILLDDGIATGSTVFAAIQDLRSRHPERLILAAPVAPPDTARKLERQVDELIILDQPPHFHAVAEFYENFDEVTDQDVFTALWGDDSSSPRTKHEERAAHSTP
ncbi:MAG TPA: phosphoribosyltransferase family protein [Oligoflexus sp.]|uniref:phosphoribosyltransferase n=1 Tax=Oligoflexus sp. TaxID=1971216 RepID=UPI002D803C6C|nr:phosphoribosyltransferase family protein [Oligoflexus sp.]HET9235619.1 phosphoribosyltransferase family protein [Oligoflexus sp.]